MNSSQITDIKNIKEEDLESLFGEKKPKETVYNVDATVFITIISELLSSKKLEINIKIKDN